MQSLSFYKEAPHSSQSTSPCSTCNKCSTKIYHYNKKHIRKSLPPPHQEHLESHVKHTPCLAQSPSPPSSELRSVENGDLCDLRLDDQNKMHNTADDGDPEEMCTIAKDDEGIDVHFSKNDSDLYDL